MKKFYIVSILLLFLTSCFGGGETTTTTSGLKLFENMKFSINVPSSWEDITKNKDRLPKPSEGKIELAITSNEVKFGFANNLLIMSQELKKPNTSKEYSIVNNIGANGDYINYKKIDSKTIEFNEGDKSYLYIFEAKYNMTTPVLKFLQVGKICKDRGYLLTLALNYEIDKFDKYESFIKTFACK